MRKDLFFLFLIVLIIASVVIFFIKSSKKELVYFELNTKSNISFLFLIEDLNKSLVSMQEIFINMKTGNIGFLDIPIHTGYEDLKGNISWFKDLYKKNSFNKFLSKIYTQLSHESDYYIRFQKENFVKLIDYLGGVRLLVKNSVKVYSFEDSILIPSGTSNFDGDKAYDYLRYFNDVNQFEERIEFFKEFFKRLLFQISDFGIENDNFLKIYSMLDTNLSEVVFKYIVKNYKINNDKIISINIKGQEEIFKDNDNNLIKVIFPYYGGAILKESVDKLNKELINEDAEEIVKIVVLNGTKVVGLAKQTANIFNSLKFKVLKFGNADKNSYKNTLIINNSDNLEMAVRVGEAIKTSNIKPISEAQTKRLLEFDNLDINPDVIVILGDDFDGRYVKSK
ncbi:LCP family protein [Borreliella californiensis]|uniref:Anionic cell wall polymer biosynthesis LytR-Cps2A-Psr (LCP) family protein n=1 Tax=Borreliella californiensis TaxID=373543 RepID=A0A7W9ZM12_9SPIR|nr:LCP family protein [Borreliella californiensis]MBB6212892.1 anionic cell wall polymer biosynthesis LytR-Cps2A-Psr (LCP) family protein [Borreliella californiensis]WKC92029.1 LCP family protein [Borreliella californiensis]WNY70781.1 LCP family protein [Borreliella californiensis]